MTDWRISWTIPAGARTSWFFGAGATRAEVTLILVGGIGGAAAVWAFWFAPVAASWQWWQLAIGIVFALDLCGGAVANATNAIKRQYYGLESAVPAGLEGRLARNPIAFASLHVYSIVIVLLYPGGYWIWGLVWYFGVVAAVTVVQAVPPYLRRPVAMLLALAAMLASGMPAPEGWAWLPLVLTAKLVLAHAVREEPYAR